MIALTFSPSTVSKEKVPWTPDVWKWWISTQNGRRQFSNEASANGRQPNFTGTLKWNLYRTIVSRNQNLYYSKIGNKMNKCCTTLTAKLRGCLSTLVAQKSKYFVLNGYCWVKLSQRSFLSNHKNNSKILFWIETSLVVVIQNGKKASQKVLFSICVCLLPHSAHQNSSHYDFQTCAFTCNKLVFHNRRNWRAERNEGSYSMHVLSLTSKGAMIVLGKFFSGLQFKGATSDERVNLIQVTRHIE